MPIISIWGWSDFLSNPCPSSNCEVLWQATHAVAEDEGVGDEQILEEPAVWVVVARPTLVSPFQENRLPRAW
jgi:O-succinylbenzoate synthase